MPIALAVHSDYDYLAVVLDGGAIVHGYAPEWESTTVVAPSFAAFLEQLCDAARSSNPEWPYSIFL